VDRVFELADIAGPRMFHQDLDRLRADAIDVLSEHLICLMEEVRGEIWQIANAVS
jgi:hypothetical protein